MRYQTAAELRGDLKRIKRGLDSSRIRAGSGSAISGISRGERWSRSCGAREVGAGAACVDDGGPRGNGRAAGWIGRGRVAAERIGEGGVCGVPSADLPPRDRAFRAVCAGWKNGDLQRGLGGQASGSVHDSPGESAIATGGTEGRRRVGGVGVGRDVAGVAQQAAGFILLICGDAGPGSTGGRSASRDSERCGVGGLVPRRSKCGGCA